MSPMPTEDRIWLAALALFARQGFAGTSTREIADASGLTAGSLYHYMGSKDDLLEQVMLGGMTGLLEAAAAVVAATEQPPQRLVSLVQLHVAVHARHRLEAKVVDREIEQLPPATRKRIGAMRDEYEGVWRGVVSAGIDAGDFGVADARLATLALLGMCTEVATWFRPKGPLTPEALGLEFAQMTLSLLRAGRSGVPLTVADLEVPAVGPFIAAYERRGGYGMVGAKAASRRGA